MSTDDDQYIYRPQNREIVYLVASVIPSVDTLKAEPSDLQP